MKTKPKFIRGDIAFGFTKTNTETEEQPAEHTINTCFCNICARYAAIITIQTKTFIVFCKNKQQVANLTKKYNDCVIYTNYADLASKALIPTMQNKIHGLLCYKCFNRKLSVTKTL